MALTSIGSILSVRISANDARAMIQRSGLILVVGCSIVIILAQLLIMLGLCCSGLDQLRYSIYMVLTGASLMGIVFGYATMVFATMKKARRSNTRKRKVTGWSKKDPPS